VDAQHLTFSVRGLPLAYSVWGDQQKAAEKGVLFCFHGFLDHGHSFATIARALTSELPVIAVDFRGFGHSGWLGDGGYYHFLDNVADAVLLHAALGSPPVHLLAHSMGGSVATAFASARPELVRSLILLEGMGPPREDLDLAPVRLRRWIESLADPVLAGPAMQRRAARKPMRDVSEAAERMIRTNPRLPRDRALELATYGSEDDPRGGVVWRFDPLHRTPGARPFNADEYAHHWREVKAPVLSLYGDASEWMLADLAERHALLASCVMGTVVNAGHNIHHDQPDVVADAVRAWVRGEQALPAGISRR